MFEFVILTSGIHFLQLVLSRPLGRLRYFSLVATRYHLSRVGHQNKLGLYAFVLFRLHT